VQNPALFAVAKRIQSPSSVVQGKKASTEAANSNLLTSSTGTVMRDHTPTAIPLGTTFGSVMNLTLPEFQGAPDFFSLRLQPAFLAGRESRDSGEVTSFYFNMYRAIARTNPPPDELEALRVFIVNLLMDCNNRLVQIGETWFNGDPVFGLMRVMR
jgi:hypothetical protein